MRQLKSCPVGSFVIYEKKLCQVNCFYTNTLGKCATLTEVKEGRRRIFANVELKTKVEFKGFKAFDQDGNFWICKRNYGRPF